jgi:hypothetical protein
MSFFVRLSRAFWTSLAMERVLTSKAVRRRGAGRRGAPPASPDYRRSRSELSTTTRLLTDMVTAANAGVSRPSAATGTATAL